MNNMERLTIPDEPIEGGMRRAIIDVRSVKKEAMTLYWALKKYEDTGLTPDEIMDGKLLTGWIPVEEKLPEKTQEVIVYTEDGVQMIGYLKNRNGNLICENLPFISKKVVAWMPLPEPYRPEAELAEMESTDGSN